MHALVLVLVLGAAPEVVETRPAPQVPQGAVAVESVPQLGWVNVRGTFDVLSALRVELGGWNTFGAQPTAFLRGGLAGARYTFVRTDAVELWGGLRLLVAQPATGQNVAVGGAAVVGTRITAFSFLALQPDFDLTRLGTLTTARFTNTLDFALGDWHLVGAGGVQLFVQDGQALQAGPAASLAVAWRHDFHAAALELAALAGLGRDATIVTSAPVLRGPTGEVQLWAGLRVAVTVPYARR